MKFYLTLLLLALVAVLQHPTAGNSVCPQENCLADASKCENLLIGGTCPQSTDTCCSIVKAEYRTHCRHFGGECMDSCAQALQQTVVDCPADKICCTLV